MQDILGENVNVLIFRACTIYLLFQTSEQPEVILELFGICFPGKFLFFDKTSNILNHSFDRLYQLFLTETLRLREIVGKGLV